jgi:PAS domain S-box-containing protein
VIATAELPASTTPVSATDRQLRLPVEAAVDFGLPCVTVDASGGIEQMNAEAEQLFGRRADRCLGRTVDVLHEALRSTTLQADIMAASEAQMPRTCRYSVSIIAGELAVSIAPIAPAGAVVFFRQVATPRALGPSDTRLRQVMDSLSDIVSITTPDGTLIYLNRAGRDLLGYAAETGSQPSGLFPTHTPLARELLLLEAVPSAIRYGRWSGDTALQAADGRVFPATQTILAHRDDAGEVTSLSTIIRDISVERHTSIALRESRRLFEVIAHATPDLLYLLDPNDGRVVWTNRCPTAFTGGLESDARAFPLARVFDRCHPDDQPAFTAHLDRLRLTLSDGDVFANELRVRGGDGQWHWLYTRDSVFTRDEHGAPLLVLGVATDISDRKVVEQQLEQARAEADAANTAKSAFLARMSHELRTPLNSVIGFSSQLLRNRSAALSAREVTFLERVRANGTHLLDIVADILDHTALEGGSLQVQQQLVDVCAVVRDAERDVQQAARTRGIALTVAVPSTPVPFVTDRGRLQQVVQHLLRNAVKFTRAGGAVQVTLTTSASGAPDRVLVHDTGVGIPLDQQARIFEAFEQADGSYARPHDGTGLGLAVARGIAELLGCALTLDASEPEVGSTFALAFPQLTRAAALAMAIEAETSDRPVARRVLVADDNAEARRIQAAILEDAGYEVRVAASGVDALRLARMWRPDVITLDMIMPGMDGRQSFRELHADPTLRHIPVIVVTVLNPSYVDLPHAAAILPKPVDRDRLLAAMATLGRPGG